MVKVQGSWPLYFFFRKFRTGNSSQKCSEEIKSWILKCWLKSQNKNKGRGQIHFRVIIKGELKYPIVAKVTRNITIKWSQPAHSVLELTSYSSVIRKLSLNFGCSTVYNARYINPSVKRLKPAKILNTTQNNHYQTLAFMVNVRDLKTSFCVYT